MYRPSMGVNNYFDGFMWKHCEGSSRRRPDLSSIGGKEERFSTAPSLALPEWQPWRSPRNPCSPLSTLLATLPVRKNRRMIPHTPLPSKVEDRLSQLPLLTENQLTITKGETLTLVVRSNAEWNWVSHPRTDTRLVRTHTRNVKHPPNLTRHQHQLPTRQQQPDAHPIPQSPSPIRSNPGPQRRREGRLRPGELYRGGCSRARPGD